MLEGHYARLEPLDPGRHGDDLHAASATPDRAVRFRYMPELPPDSPAVFGSWLAESARSTDPLFFAVIDRATGRAEGWQTFLRITPVHRCIEIGNIYWGPRIAGTRVATEAMYLFIAYALGSLGYRRYEWKCDALNAPSRRAALRFGMTLRRPFPPRGDHPRPQSRHLLVLDHRRGVAGPEGRLRPVARSRELRRRGAAEDAAQRADGGGARAGRQARLTFDLHSAALYPVYLPGPRLR